ncbi:hypothetical protein F4X73_10675 [Candidatus Poribacteria bacterium]|nr:hypothetical protein [Candidatus Poribacteria bacterium]
MMKIKSLVAMCMLVLLLGVTAFMVNSDVDTSEDANTTQDAETPHEAEINEENTESNEDSTDHTDVEKLTKKIEELYKELDTIKDADVDVVDSIKIDGEDGWRVYKIIPDVKSKIIRGEDLDVTELSEIIKALDEKIDIDLNAIVDPDNIRVLRKDVSILSKKLLDSAEVDKLTEKIVKLTEELSADSDELSKQIKELLKNYQVDTKKTFGVGGVKVIRIDPSGSATVVKDLKAIEDIQLKIKELTKDSDSDALVDTIRKLIEKNHSDSSVIMEKDGVKVFEINPDKSKKNADNSDDISELKERVNQLEDKIDQLIQKLGTDDSESSENQK